MIVHLIIWTNNKHLESSFYITNQLAHLHCWPKEVLYFNLVVPFQATEKYKGKRVQYLAHYRISAFFPEQPP